MEKLCKCVNATERVKIEEVIVTKPFRQSFAHDQLTTISNEETFLQDFLVLMKLSLNKYLYKCIVLHT